MESYRDFSRLYDSLIIKDVDYKRWADYIFKLFDKYKVTPKLVADLGCGTGSLTCELAERGCEMIGVDQSADMLLLAREKAEKKSLDIMFLNQDMSKFKLYGSVNAIISSLDCVNYLTRTKQLENLFKQVAFYLEPDGIFIFDVNSKYKMEQILGNNTFTYDSGDIFYVWESRYSKRTKTCEYHLTFFEEKDGVYTRTDEYQRQRLYERDEIERAAAGAGLKIDACYGDLTMRKPSKKCERFFYIIRK